MRAGTIRLLLPALLLGAALSASGEPQPVRIEPDERVVHVVGVPFDHAYYEHHLEKLLVGRYAHIGLVYRRVTLNRTTADLVKTLESSVLIHRPTLVVYQPGNADMMSQWRRTKKNYKVYPSTVEKLVSELRKRNIRLIACSVIPLGTSESRDKLTPLNEGLKGWVEAVRESAAGHGAVFVDLFNEAVTWRMIAAHQNHYGSAEHKKSWELLLRQVRFEPERSVVSVSVKDGAHSALHASIGGLEAGRTRVAFSLTAWPPAGPVVVRLADLAPGSFNVSVDGKELPGKSAAALAAGVDIAGSVSAGLRSSGFSKELKAGHGLSRALGDAEGYRLPGWVKCADFDAQKAAELKRVLAALDEHDKKLRAMVNPKPVAVVIQSVTKP